MKVRISIPGTYMAMETEEEQARRVFRKLVESLWLIRSKSQKQLDDPSEGKEGGTERAAPIHAIETEPVPELAEEALPEEKMEESEEVAEGSEISEKAGKEPSPKILSTGYGGYLYMKCPVCGKTRGFCAKTRLNNFRCECGAVTKMGNMVPLYIKCECGRQAKYRTNMTDTAFDILCYDCGAPVAVEWNEKKQMYETMK